MQRHARRDLAIAVVESNPFAEDVADHHRDVLHRKRMSQRAEANAAPGGVAHLAVLQMKPRLGKAVEIAGVVEMQMGDDDVLDAVGVDAKARKSEQESEVRATEARLRFPRVKVDN